MSTQQKYIKIQDMLINVNHIVLLNRSLRHFDGEHIELHLSNNYCVSILKANSALYDEIKDFMINDANKKNVLTVYSDFSTAKR